MGLHTTLLKKKKSSEKLKYISIGLDYNRILGFSAVFHYYLQY